MKQLYKRIIACVVIIGGLLNPIYGQHKIMFDSIVTTLPEDAMNVDIEPSLADKQAFSAIAKMPNGIPTVYKYGKYECYNKNGENDEWKLNYTLFYDYNDLGCLIKQYFDVDTRDNDYTLYFYDEQNRNIKIECFFDDGYDVVKMESYYEIEYLNDFPYLESSRIHYTETAVDWNQSTGEWECGWEINSGFKRDYTISKKVDNHYEKKVDYTYNTGTKQWDVSGYKYDYVVNAKGLIAETLVYKATEESEDKWPLILHVKNLINDKGVVFRSDRFNYQGSTPYIERWSNIKWDRHDGNMPISGCAVQGANRIKTAKIEYLLVSDPNTEYIPSRDFSSEYQNNESFHYVINDNNGNKLVDNSYYKELDNSLQELWQGDVYQMQYYDFDEHNWVIYDHYVKKHFYEGDNVITERDWHRYTYQEYYLDSDELTLSELYEYDALTASEPYGRSRSVYSDYKEYSADINDIISNEGNQIPSYYNLQGLLIHSPHAGQLVIRRIGNKVDKIIFR